jgi:hypothetical protein
MNPGAGLQISSRFSHDAWLSTEWRPKFVRKMILCGQQITSQQTQDLRARVGRGGDAAPPGRDAESLRRSSWNYPRLERSAAPFERAP